VRIAKENPGKEVVFFAVGFETTAPANALSVIHAARDHINNYSILASHVLVPPAIEEVMNDELSNVNGFLGAGHVCAIMGIYEYYPLVEKYKVPIVITGFEPVDLLQGIYMVVKQLEAGEAKVENQYSRIVKEEGNLKAQETIYEVFEVTDRLWRGMEIIPMSGYKVKDVYHEFDAEKKFNIHMDEAPENPECIAGDIMKGIKKPFECQHFGKKCKPVSPLGAPMVSNEGACAAYYHYSGMAEEMMTK
jgi:hydrogenase expression/formation protein HypD